MAEFKTVIADPKEKKAYQKVLAEDKSNALVGKSVGEEIDGIFLDLPGYRLKITGGSDNSGVRDNTYPNAVYTDGSTPEPSIRSRKLYIPLNLWFCLNKQQALPLCALQYNEIELRITLRPISELFTIRDVTDATNDYPRLAPNFNIAEHAFYRFIQEPVDPENNIYSNTSTSWNQDIHLLANYIFLSDEEKSIFTAYDHKYLFKEVHEYTFNDICLLYTSDAADE